MIGELAVAEPVSERIQRVAARDVAVPRRPPHLHVARAARGLVVVVDRHLADPPREGDGQLAARVDLAEHDVGDRVAGLDAGEPRLEDRRRVVVDAAQRQRAAAEEHDDERLAGRLDAPRSAPPARPAGRSRFRRWPRRSAPATRRARARPGRRPSRPPRRRRTRPSCRTRPRPCGPAPPCRSIEQPSAYVVVPVLCALMPSKTVTASLSSPLPHHGPSMSCWFLASGPITAVFLPCSAAAWARRRRS